MTYIDWKEKLNRIKQLPLSSLIALTIFGECRSAKEPYEGKVQVGWVAYRREINTLSWDDILDDKQFSCYNYPVTPGDERNFNAISSVLLIDPVFIECQRIADGILTGTIPEPLSPATHYHTAGVYPNWAAKFQLLGKIGSHLFYVDNTAIKIKKA